MEDSVLCNTSAASGRMLPSLSKKNIKRAAVIAHFETLVPVVREMGTRVHIGFVRSIVSEFLWKTRPRGKSEAPCGLFARILNRSNPHFGLQVLCAFMS